MRRRQLAVLDMADCACGDTPCIVAKHAKLPCARVPADAPSVSVIGLRCLAAGAMRGLYLQARASSTERACSGGDRFHVSVVGDRLRFAALSQAASRDDPSLHWVNLSALAIVTGRHTYSVTVSLTETDTSFDADADWSLSAWLRHSRCSWRRVGTADVEVVVARRAGASASPAQCGAPGSYDASATGYVRLDDAGTCGHGPEALCTGGPPSERLINTSNPQRLQQRTGRGYRHILKPLGCRLHLFGEEEVARCLAGRAVLNMGSDVAIDISRGFGRLNSTLAAWTRTRPGSTEEQRKKFKDRRPTVADWSYQYERSGGFNGRGPDLMVGQSRFGAGSVETMFIAEPHTMLKSQCIRCSAHH